MSSKSSASIRLVILEDYPVVREGLGQWLARHDDIDVCAEIAALADVRAAIERTRATVLLMDLMPNGADGVGFIRTIAAEVPSVRVLVFSMHDEGLYAERVLRAGAMGYLSKSAIESELVAAVRTVASNAIYVSPRLSLILLGRLLRPVGKNGDRNGLAGLTDRELHVFQLLGTGLAVREISGRLGVSAKTVQAHRENIKNKLGFETAAELVRHAALWLTDRNDPRSGPGLAERL